MSTEVTKVNKNQLSLPNLLKTDAIKQRIEQVLGARAPQFASSLLIVVKNNDRLSEADPNSVMSSAMIAATLDLSIDPNLGQAHIVPYAKVAQLQIGYKGFIQLAQRSGQFKTITDTVIPAGVLISYDPLTENLVIDWAKEKKAGKPDGYVFYFELLNGFSKTIFWSYDKAHAHGMKYSQAFKKKKKDCPWITNFDAMALKSVIKHGLNKYAPLSIEMQKAIEVDQSVDGDYPDNTKEEVKPTFTDKAEKAKPVKEEKPKETVNSAGEQINEPQPTEEGSWDK